MRLTDIMVKNGFQPVSKVFPESKERDNPKLKIFTDNDIFIGVQKIGNVWRIDAQQISMGIIPHPKMIDNFIIQKDELESTIMDILNQINEVKKPEES